MGGLSLPLGWTIGRYVFSKKVLEDFLDVHFSCVIIEGRIVDSNMDGFFCSQHSLFYLEVGDVGFGLLLEMLSL